MPTSYINHTLGSQDEQLVIEDLIIESIEIKGVDLIYIPRTLGNLDKILHEDRISTFKDAFFIRGYFKNVSEFDGQQSFLSKYGLQIEQQATITIARRKWDQLVGKYGRSILPQRPAEGDLIFFPLTKGLFEIKYVEYLNPFFQIGKLYVYDMKLELFQYASEKLETGIPEVDAIEVAKTLNLDVIGSFHILMEFGGSLLLEDGSLVIVEDLTGFENQANHWGNNEDYRLIADQNEFNESNPFGNPLP